jgi:hypothetical protein
MEAVAWAEGLVSGGGREGAQSQLGAPTIDAPAAG